MTKQPARKYASPRQVDRRKRILRSASAHLEAKGLEALSMSSIARASEVSVKTLYNLFGSRDELLLEAAAETLVDLGQSEVILAAEKGIPRLLTYVVSTMEDFIKAPGYAHAIISILAKADMEQNLTDLHMGVVRRFAEASLQVAADQGELIEGVETEMIAQHISANQWGAVLLWIKGLIDISDLPRHVAYSHYMTLIPVCIGSRRAHLEQEFKALLAS